MKPGPRCTVCLHTKRGEIESVSRKQSPAFAASKYGLPRSTVAKHFQKCRQLPRVKAHASKDALPGSEPKPACRPVLAPTPPGTSEVDAMRAQVDWLEKLVAFEQSNGESGPRDWAALVGQLTNAKRHLAKLSGSLQVSSATIVKSADWPPLRDAYLDSLEEVLEAKHPDLLLRVLDAFIRRVSKLAGIDTSDVLPSRPAGHTST
jgi:hypothetical protein